MNDPGLLKANDVNAGTKITAGFEKNIETLARNVYKNKNKKVNNAFFFILDNNYHGLVFLLIFTVNDLVLDSTENENIC